MAPLQKRALLTLIIGLAFTVALVVVLVLEGDINSFNNNETLRWITYAALIGVPLTYLILIDLTLRKPSQLDERDRLIMTRAGRTQWLAVVFSLAAWVDHPHRGLPGDAGGADGLSHPDIHLHPDHQHSGAVAGDTHRLLEGGPQWLG